MSAPGPAERPLRLGPAPSRAEDQAPTPPAAWAYLVRCADGSLYAGWTSDLARRLRRHTAAGRARATRACAGPCSWPMRAAAKTRAKPCAPKPPSNGLPKAEKEALAARWGAEQAVTVRPGDCARRPGRQRAVQLVCAPFEPRPSSMRPANAGRDRADHPRGAGHRAVPAGRNAAGQLCGYACAHPLHPREAYAWCVETTIYCAHRLRGAGGRPAGCTRRCWSCCAARATVRPRRSSRTPTRAARRSTRRWGFRSIGRQPRCGYKFGRWLDLQTWWLDLRPGEAPPAPVRRQLPAEETAAVLASCTL